MVRSQLFSFHPVAYLLATFLQVLDRIVSAQLGARGAATKKAFAQLKISFVPFGRVDMRETVLLVAAALFVVMTSTAHAIIRITADPGGLIGAYADRFQQARASGEPVHDRWCLFVSLHIGNRALAA